MHAVFLTFEFAGEARDLSGTFGRFAETAQGEPGVINCTWMNDGATIGAFYVFQSMDAAERYLNSAHLRTLAAHPGVYDFYIRHFSTLDTISTSLPSTPSLLQSSDIANGNACAVWQSEVESLVEQQSA